MLPSSPLWRSLILKSLIIVTECYGSLSSGAVVHSKDLLHKLTTRTSTSCGKTTTNHSLLKEKPSLALIACTNNRAAKVRSLRDCSKTCSCVTCNSSFHCNQKAGLKMFSSFKFKRMINELIEVGLGFEMLTILVPF